MRSIYIFLSLLVFLALTSNAQAVLTLTPLGTYSTGIFDDSAAEAVAYDPVTDRLFVTNASGDKVDVLDISDPTNPALVLTIDTAPFGNEPTGVAVNGGIVAVAVRNQPAGGEGKVVFFSTDGFLINSVQVGFGPDNIVFTPDGMKVLVANEGRPSDNYENDPEGSVSIIDLSGGVASATVTTASFTTFNGQEDQLRDQGVRIFGPIVQNGSIVGVASAAKDLEPESIAVSDDSKTAWVTLQENNAVATLNIAAAMITDIKGLGFTNYQADEGNGFDASDQDGGINIARWKARGMFQPDGIDVFTMGGQSYLVTANEGNARDYSGFSEKARLKDVNVNPGLQGLQDDEKLGRLFITTEPPHGKIIKKDGEAVFNKIYSFGSRSFSIWSANTVELVFDSGADFEQITATAFPENFNADHKNIFASSVPDNLDRRSAEKGPEPESVVVENIGGQTYAFIGLERIGGVMVYDVTNPFAPIFQSYVNNRDFDFQFPNAGDLGIEGLVFISASDSPNGNPLLVTANKVSGTTTVFQVVDVP